MISSEGCINITTNTDTFVEADEMFMVSVVSIDPPLGTVAIDPANQAATIQDISSRCT